MLLPWIQFCSSTITLSIKISLKIRLESASGLKWRLCRDSMLTALQLTDSSVILAKQFSSLLFSHFGIHVCNLDLNSWFDLEFMQILVNFAILYWYLWCFGICWIVLSIPTLIDLWEIWSFSCKFWLLGEELKGYVWYENPRIWLECVESWESHTNWETIDLIITCLVDLNESTGSEKRWLARFWYFALS